MKILIDTPIWLKAFRRKKVKSGGENIVDSLKYLIGGIRGGKYRSNSAGIIIRNIRWEYF
jgi:hypothetical protein